MISIEQLQLAEEERTQQTATTPMLEADLEFNWRNCWYPVTFLQDLPKNRPYSFSLYDEPLVLFRNEKGKLGCIIDRCSHRLAKLSDGPIVDGKLECPYHGWQFGIDGQCLDIPQLPTDAKIPAKACLQSFKVVERQDMIWVWAGKPEAADEESIPIVPELDRPEFISLDLVYDRPYDQTYFIENVIDPAHVPVSHNGSDGNRKNAQPLAMEVIKTSVEGIRGRFRNTKKPNENWIDLDFIAPNLILYRSQDLPKAGCHDGLALYSVPLGKDRCRVLSRFYRNFSTWEIKLKPRWYSHWYRSRVIEEDILITRGVQAQVEGLGKNLKDLYLPLKTSDLLVIEYRKWLDRFGSSLPFYQGYDTLKLAENHNESHRKSEPIDRFSGHTLICGSCNRAYQVTKKVKQGFLGVAMAMATLALITEESATRLAVVSAFVSAVLLALSAEQVKTKFKKSYTRP